VQCGMRRQRQHAKHRRAEFPSAAAMPLLAIF
jgi:hypothetical protein